ncbi:MAG TPA: aminopeptidase N [Hyphomicrobiaceae bacterium]|jgi:aminopeptidase N|nr:aminopeptidase N [Hyphomicrobiaceae bacterium]
MKTETPRPILLKDYRPPNYLIDHVDLDVSLRPERTRVSARLKMRPNPAFDGEPGALRLDGELLELEGVRLDGRPLSPADFTSNDKELVIGKPPSRAFALELVNFCNPEANKALSGLYRSRGIYCTQCEAQGFRRITYFLDRPDVLATYTTRLEAERDEAPVLLSNGNPVEEGVLDRGKRHFAVWRDPHPKPSYLFALVGGDLAHLASEFVTASGRKVALKIYVEPGKEGRCAWAMDALKRAMRWDEERFGREYDLDVFNIVAVSDFNMGAMENKGLNIFNDALVLASPETASDQSFADIERVIAHEYFHNWTGNRITCRDWFQLCLKEGLTVFRDQEFCADQRSATVQRIRDVRNLKARQFPEDSGPLAHPVRPDRYIEINNFYTATVYEKGAELVRMIQTLLGHEQFRKGLDLYFERHDGQAATVEQFVTCFEDSSGKSLHQFMTWYAQAGTPELVCKLKWDRRAKTAELTITQLLPSTPGEARKRPLQIPVRLGLIGHNGHDLDLVLASGDPLAGGLIELGKRSETFRFKDVPSRPVPSLLRGFSAPVNLSIDHSEADLQFLMANDSDLYNRWQAAQEYATRVLIAGVKAVRAEKTPDRPDAFIGALGVTVANHDLDPGYRAQFMFLPGENDIARVLGRDVDPLAVHLARNGLRKAIGTSLNADLRDIYQRYEVKGRYSPAAEFASRRALRNAALGYLTSRGRREDIARVAAHFQDARNATDELNALAMLAELRSPERTRAFARYYERWKDDHLVIDNWFAYQAVSPLPSALAQVEKLARHPLFSLKNPNKVRALIGTFAVANPVTFNRPDGKGYAFVAQRVLELDRFNPQIAARLLSAFRSWKMLEPQRRRLAKKTLGQIAKTKPLSPDVTEIVGKMLE